MGTATTVREAVALEQDGVDAVVAQGYEAGGHRGTFLDDFDQSLIGTLALVPQVADAVSVPVIASGGIMDGRGIAAALALGAQMGTAFLSTEESGICDAYRPRCPPPAPSSRASPGPFRDGRHAASPMHSCATWTLIRPTSCPIRCRTP